MKRVCKKWSEEEKDILREHSIRGIEFLANKLPDRSEQAIRTKCCYMGLYLDDIELITEKFYMVV